MPVWQVRSCQSRCSRIIVWNIQSCFFMCVSVSNLHFPQMNLASEKPPEAVLEGVIFKIFLGEHAPRPPYIMLCFAHHPSSLREIWPDRFFLASYGPAVRLLSASTLMVASCQEAVAYLSNGVLFLGTGLALSPWSCARQRKSAKNLGTRLGTDCV